MDDQTRAGLSALNKYGPGGLAGGLNEQMLKLRGGIFKLGTSFQPMGMGQAFAPPTEGDAYAAGGPVNGPGTSTSDSIPAKLSKGEYVIPAHIVAKKGTDFFDKMIDPETKKPGGMKAPVVNGEAHAADGGLLDDPARTPAQRVLGPNLSPEATAYNASRVPPAAPPPVRSGPISPGASPTGVPFAQPPGGMTGADMWTGAKNLGGNIMRGMGSAGALSTQLVDPVMNSPEVKAQREAAIAGLREKAGIDPSAHMYGGTAATTAAPVAPVAPPAAPGAIHEGGMRGFTEATIPTAPTTRTMPETEEAAPQPVAAPAGMRQPLNILGEPVQQLTEAGGYKMHGAEVIPWHRGLPEELQRTLTADQYTRATTPALAKDKSAEEIAVEREKVGADTGRTTAMERIANIKDESASALVDKKAAAAATKAQEAEAHKDFNAIDERILGAQDPKTGLMKRGHIDKNSFFEDTSGRANATADFKQTLAKHKVPSSLLDKMSIRWDSKGYPHLSNIDDPTGEEILTGTPSEVLKTLYQGYHGQ